MFIHEVLYDALLGGYLLLTTSTHTQISPQLETMALMYLQMFTWNSCRDTMRQRIKEANHSGRDVKESDDSVGFDSNDPNFGWFLCSKNIVKRYLALVKYDRSDTVQPVNDDPAKVSLENLTTDYTDHSNNSLSRHFTYLPLIFGLCH